MGSGAQDVVLPAEIQSKRWNCEAESGGRSIGRKMCQLAGILQPVRTLHVPGKEPHVHWHSSWWQAS